MSEPITKLDPRFSDPNTTATEWSEAQQVLETAELFWLTTVRADGRPHMTPLVAVWYDGAMHFSTGADEQKAVNLRKNSHVLLTTGCNTWDRGLDVVVEGEAVRVTDNERLKRLAQAWRSKWNGAWQYDVRDGSFYHEAGGAALVFSVKPTKVFAFGKGNFTMTRHQF